MAFASKKASCALRGVQTASQQAALGAWFSSLLGKCLCRDGSRQAESAQEAVSRAFLSAKKTLSEGAYVL